MAEANLCLICSSARSSESDTSPQANFATISRLSDSLEVYFFWKHVISLPIHLIRSCLASCNDFQLTVCGSCNAGYLIQCVSLCQELMEVSRKLQEVRQKIVAAVKESGGESESSSLSIWKEVRSFVKQHNYADAAADFDAGDLQAHEKLVSKLTEECMSIPATNRETNVKEEDTDTPDDCWSDCSPPGSPPPSPSDVKSYQRRTTSKSSKNCEECDYVTPHQSALTKHKKRFHSSDLASLTCTVCKSVFHSPGNLRRHIASANHSNSPKKQRLGNRQQNPKTENLQVDCKLYNCTVCTYKSENQLYVYIHERRKHALIPSTYTCALCSFSVSHWLIFRKHMFSVHSITGPHKNRPEPQRKLNVDASEVDWTTCPDCGKPTRKGTSLEMHRISHWAPSERCFKCRMCSTVYKTAASLRVHFNIQHFSGGSTVAEIPGPLKCPRCDKVCKNRVALNSHLFHVHRSADMACESCGSLFASDLLLRRHQVSAHHRCFVVGCQEMCTSKEELYIHQMEVHKKETYIWKCEKCGSLFSAMIYFKMHKKRHAQKEGDPFMCEICGKGFSVKDYVRYHIQHTHLNKGRSKRKPKPQRVTHVDN